MNLALLIDNYKTSISVLLGCILPELIILMMRNSKFLPAGHTLKVNGDSGKVKRFYGQLGLFSTEKRDAKTTSGN